MNDVFITFLHDIRRHSDLPRFEILDLAFNVELSVSSMRRHSSMSMDTFHVIYKAWCLSYSRIELKKQVRQCLLDEWLEGRYTSAHKSDISLDT